MKLAFIIGGILVFALDYSAADDTNSVASEEADWKAFVTKYRKVYRDEDETKKRKEAFLDNRRRVKEHNALHAEGKKTFTVKLNEFSDRTRAENAEQHSTGIEFPLRKKGAEFDSSRSVVPPTFDWRRKHVVTPVVNQGNCESDWAIVAADSIQAHSIIKGTTTPQLSAQQILDCIEGEESAKCDGGLVNEAYKYILESGGLESEKNYPYNPSSEMCSFNSSKVVANITNYVDLDEGDEDMLRTAVAVVGPVAVVVDSSQWSFLHYADGIYYEPLCSSTVVDHSLLIVGYGSANGTDFWSAKNSFGLDWGRKGYMRIARNSDNHCGIAKLASYPDVKGNKKKRRRNIKLFNLKIATKRDLDL